MALTLAAAMVTSSSTPLVLLDGDLVVVAASLSFCRDFEVDCAKIEGGPVFAIGAGEWDSPKLRSLLGAIATSGAEIDAYEIDLNRVDRGVRRLVLNAHRLDYDNQQGVRVLLAVHDITEARARDAQRDRLIHEKAVLVQEIQHRVANSLQIVASVLMQSARKTQSEETRGHLNDAHHRVMSVAQVQRQLTASAESDVALKPYLGQLCASIGASMIHDSAQLSLVTEVDNSIVDPDISVSIGLMVTELVINALKHAFPDARHGRIEVAYRGAPNGWTLSVTDDGIGMPANDSGVKAGLGTTIVLALAKQLNAAVQVSDAGPGTRVVIRHTVLKLVDRVVVEPQVQPV